MNNTLDPVAEDQLPPFAIPLAEAQKRAANWIESDPGSIKPTQMRAFVVRREDFKELLSQHDTEFIRLYVGLEADAENKNKPRPCVLLVSADYQRGVSPDGLDPERIVDLVGWKKPTPEASEENYHVFDFSKPCPTYCDEDSPLFVRSSTGEGC